MKAPGYFYLGQPYSHSDFSVMEERFRRGEVRTALLLKEGYHVYAPIVHCHELAKRHALPTDAKFWREYNRVMLRTSIGLIVLPIPGWQESVGLTGEILMAREMGLPVYLDMPYGETL